MTRVVSGAGSIGPGILDELGFIPERPERLGHAPQAAPDSLGPAAGHCRAPPAS